MPLPVLCPHRLRHTTTYRPPICSALPKPISTFLDNLELSILEALVAGTSVFLA